MSEGVGGGAAGSGPSAASEGGPEQQGSDGPVVGAVVLAAGGSVRFGGHKLLAELDGRPVVRRAVDNVLAAGVDQVVVVVGREGDRVREALAGLPVSTVWNPRWQDGMSTSILVGVAALGADVEGALVALGDQPGVTPDIVKQVLETWRRSGRPVVTPVYRGVPGNPVFFQASVFPELMELSGDVGARSVVERAPGRVARLELDRPMPRDVDTREDLEALEGGGASGGMSPDGGAP